MPLLVLAGRRPLRAVSSRPARAAASASGTGWSTRPCRCRTDRDDPAAHLAELADQLGLDGPGVGLLTGVDVAEVVARRRRPGCGSGRRSGWARPVLRRRRPTPADRPAAGRHGQHRGRTCRPGSATRPWSTRWPPRPRRRPRRSASWGCRGTGTPTDAVTVLCPADGRRAAYGGPRSALGRAAGPGGARRRARRRGRPVGPLVATAARTGADVSDRSAVVGGVADR